MAADPSFVAYCCELLSGVGSCQARRMFGGAGISTGGLTFALLADLGHGEKLWLKGGGEANAVFEAAACEPFVYQAKGRPMKMNYYSAPEEAMESPQLMAPWARLALDCALKARAARVPRTRSATKSIAKRGASAKTAPTSPPTSRSEAAPAKPSARRKSRSG